MTNTRWFSAAALAFLLAGSDMVQAKPEKKLLKDLPSFSKLQAPAPDAARGQAQAWLNNVGKIDAATQKAFDALWATDRSLLDKVTGTFALGNPDVARLLQEARDPETPAPTSVPNLLKDRKLSPFFRANLGLAYAKTLTSRKVYDEALEAFKALLL